MINSIAGMTKGIVSVLGENVHSIWLYGSVVQDDFRPGWSDIDILALTRKQFTDSQALKLVQLRQDIRQWLKGLGPVVQQYADVLEAELSGL